MRTMVSTLAIAVLVTLAISGCQNQSAPKDERGEPKAARTASSDLRTVPSPAEGSSLQEGTCTVSGSAFLKLQRNTDPLAGITVNLFPWGLYELQLQDHQQKRVQQRNNIRDAIRRLAESITALESDYNLAMIDGQNTEQLLAEGDECIVWVETFSRDYIQQEQYLKEMARRPEHISYFNPLTATNRTFTRKDFSELPSVVSSAEQEMKSYLVARLRTKTISQRNFVFAPDRDALEQARRLLQDLQRARGHYTRELSSTLQEASVLQQRKDAAERERNEKTVEMTSLNNSKDLTLPAALDILGKPGTQERTADEEGHFRFAGLDPGVYGLFAVHESDLERVVWIGRVSFTETGKYQIILTNTNASSIETKHTQADSEAPKVKESLRSIRSLSVDIAEFTVERLDE